MSSAATRKDIDEVIDIMRDFMQQTSNEFAEVRQQMTRGFAEVNEQLVVQNDKYDRLLQTIDGFISRIDHYETEQKMRDYQFEKLLSWARKVSEKTGIPLEHL